jgi:thiamine biosynthesis lipoprotein
VKAIAFDPVRRQARLSPGTRLDLGATGKALAVDRAVARAAAMTGCGVLVSIGGDVATAGEAPHGGWSIGIADDHRAGAGQIQQTVAITHGAIATSSTLARSWECAGTPCHHIIDPGRGRSAIVHWRTVSVAADSCVVANTATTAAIVDGTNARRRLLRARLPARLVTTTGSVVTLGGWPRVAEHAA